MHNLINFLLCFKLFSFFILLIYQQTSYSITIFIMYTLHIKYISYFHNYTTVFDVKTYILITRRDNNSIQYVSRKSQQLLNGLVMLTIFPYGPI
jgi:hypothetical protein